MLGRVKVWDEARFFGIVIIEAGDYFFHGSAVAGPIAKNDLVDFWLDDNTRGPGLVAIDVQRHAPLSKNIPRESTTLMDAERKEKQV